MVSGCRIFCLDLPLCVRNTRFSATFEWGLQYNKPGGQECKPPASSGELLRCNCDLQIIHDAKDFRNTLRDSFDLCLDSG